MRDYSDTAENQLVAREEKRNKITFSIVIGLLSLCAAGLVWGHISTQKTNTPENTRSTYQRE